MNILPQMPLISQTRRVSLTNINDQPQSIKSLWARYKLTSSEKYRLYLIQSVIKKNDLSNHRFSDFIKWYFSSQLHFNPDQIEEVFDDLKTSRLFIELDLEGQEFSDVQIKTDCECIRLIMQSLGDEVVSFKGMNLKEADLKNLHLSWLNFDSAIFSSADLSGSDFHGSSFAESYFDHANLGQCCLQKTECLNANFNEASLLHANLRGAKLINARFNNADLSYADLTSANLMSACLFGAHLRHTNLSKANLEGSNCRELFFKNVILTGANLKQADLSNTVWKHVQLDKADLNNADLHGARFTFTSMTGANLRYARLYRAELMNVDFSYADLSYAVLRTADFSGANLSYAKLHQVNINRANFERANFDHVTIMSIQFPSVFDEYYADIYFNHQKRTRSLLSAIDSIDDKYIGLKINLMESVINRIFCGTANEKKLILKYKSDFKRFLKKKDSFYLLSESISKFIRLLDE